MPRRPKKMFQKRQLTACEIAYLSDDNTVSDDNDFTLWCYRIGMEGFGGDPKPSDIWREHGGDFLPQFIKKNPGRRSIAWWHWTSPRQPDHGTGFWYEGMLPEPRKRIGGSGVLHKGYVPFYQYGIPQHWDAKTLDPNDPLIFESQTAFLIRYSLLLPQEKKYIAGHPQLLKPEILKIYGD